MQMTSKQLGKLKTGTAVGYGIGAIGEGIGYNVFFSFFIFFLTTVAGIEPAIAGVISGVAVLWDAITDPLIGNWSDKTKNPNGRRRPFIMIGSVLFGICIALLFIDIDIAPGAKVIYFIIINALYWVTLTTCVIPHISLGSELTEDFDERTKLRTYAASLMAVGTMIATSATLIVVEFYAGVFGSETAGWAGMGITYGVIVIVVYNLCCKIIKKREPENPNLKKAEAGSAASEENKKDGSFFKNAVKAIKNKPLRLLLIITFVVNIVVTLGSGLAVYVFTYVFGYDEVKTSQVFFIQSILLIIAVFVAGYVAKKTEKKTAMVVGLIMYMMAFLIIAILPVKDMTIYISIVFFALGNSAYWTMIYAMSYDTAIIQQIKTDEKPDGLYTSLIGLLMKIGNSIGSVVVGVGLQMVGFNASLAVQSDATLQGIRMLYAWAPSIILALGVIAAICYPLTKKKYNELVELYHAKQNGEAYDEESLKKIL